MVRLNYHHSEETKKKIGLGNKGKTKGIKRSEEFKQKLSIVRTGKKLSIETKIKIGNANRGHIIFNRKGKTWKELFGEEKAEQMRLHLCKINKGHIVTEKTKLKISLGNKGKTKGIKRHPLTKEHRKKLSLIRKGQPSNMKGKKHKIKSILLMKEKRKYQITPLQDTSIETKIQNFLKELNINFYTHQYIKEISHGYQCDIFIPLWNLIIECDGAYWHKYPNGREIDHVRTKELLENNFKVLRLWEHDINNMNLEEFKKKLSVVI